MRNMIRDCNFLQILAMCKRKIPDYFQSIGQLDTFQVMTTVKCAKYTVHACSVRFTFQFGNSLRYHNLLSR